HAAINELESGFAKANVNLNLKTLRAPVDGTVQQLAIHTVGGVVTPAQPLLVIVPDKEGLVVQAMIDNRDIGFVRPGQDAEVKLDTFTFTHYGLIEGKVSSVSHDVVAYNPSTKDKDNPSGINHIDANEAPKPAYVARVSLSRNWMETENGRVALGPGMA